MHLDSARRQRIRFRLLMPIAFIDAHVHAHSRSGEDFGRLRVAGCMGLVAVADEGGGYRGPDSVLDHFRRLDRVDRPRVERAGLKFFLALGIHPRGIPEKGVDEVLKALPDALSSHRASALGEIGLERGGDREEGVLAEQLAIAAEAGLPAIVHTPRKEKKRAVVRILDLLSKSRIEPGKILLDHLNDETLDLALDAGCRLGLAVHPAKLSPDQAAGIVARHGPRFLLSTDMGASSSFLFGIPAAISAMQDRGLDDAVIRAVVHDNAARFLGLDT
jgi:predicted metal-dependent TIM-barrel fold hydrolase